MRHMMFAHGFAHGFAGFMIFRMIRRALMGVVFILLIVAVIYFWSKSRRRYDY